jgi:hypothetical protein
MVDMEDRHENQQYERYASEDADKTDDFHRPSY